MSQAHKLNLNWFTVVYCQCHSRLQHEALAIKKLDSLKKVVPCQSSFSSAVKEAQSPRRWWPSSVGHGWKAILSSPGSGRPTGRNLCRDLARRWTRGISPSLTAAAPGATTTHQCLRGVLVLHHTVRFITVYFECHHLAQLRALFVLSHVATREITVY